jgi:hypothetical protein
MGIPPALENQAIVHFLKPASRNKKLNAYSHRKQKSSQATNA